MDNLASCEVGLKYIYRVEGGRRPCVARQAVLVQGKAERWTNQLHRDGAVIVSYDARSGRVRRSFVPDTSPSPAALLRFDFRRHAVSLQGWPSPRFVPWCEYREGDRPRGFGSAGNAVKVVVIKFLVEIMGLDCRAEHHSPCLRFSRGVVNRRVMRPPNTKTAAGAHKASKTYSDESARTALRTDLDPGGSRCICPVAIAGKISCVRIVG